MNSYHVKIFNFMDTHPSNISKVTFCHYTYTLESSWGGWWWGDWRVHRVGGGKVGGWRVHGGCVCVVV